MSSSAAGDAEHSWSTVRRVRGLVGLAVVIVALWGSVAVVEQVVHGSRGSLTDGARLATQPLWFLAAYVPFVLLASSCAGALRRPVRMIALCTALVCTGDAARFLFDAPRSVAFPGFFAAWSVPFVIGWWWRSDSRARGSQERSIGIAMFMTGTIGCFVLVRWFGYTWRLIDAVAGGRSNSTPPTLFTVAACLSQAGAFMAVAQPCDALARRCGRAVRWTGRVAAATYVWHLTAVALCAVPLLLGLPFPVRFSTTWWLVRPLWFGAVLAVTCVLVAVTRRSSSREPAITDVQWPVRGPRVLLATSCVAVGAGLTGLWGPTSPPRAAISSITFVVAWWLLRCPPMSHQRNQPEGESSL